MTIKQTYEYLLQIKILESKIQNAIIQVETLRSCLLPSGIRYDLDKVQTSPADQMSGIESRVIDLEHDIKQMEHQKNRLIVQITNAIYCLQNDDEKTVLLAYYIGRKRIEDIADEIPVSVRTAYYIKRKAISHLAAILK